MNKIMPVIAVIAAGSVCLGSETNDSARGRYFAKKEYRPQPLPAFAEFRDQLPAPVLDPEPEWLAMYWKAWELAFRNFHEPGPRSGFVSHFIDAAFNENIFLWDTCFMTMFCNVASPLVPGIESLDNFYARQHADGEICREIKRATGEDYGPWVNRERKPLFTRNGWVPPEHPNAPVLYQGRRTPEVPPCLTLDALNNPLFAWAEWESYRVTGNTQRLGVVFEPLQHYYGALREYLRQGNGLYTTDWASMDNSPRNAYLTNGGCAVDTSCQMVLFARHLAAMAALLDKSSESRNFDRDAHELSRTINRLMWDEKRRFYFDLTLEGKRAPVRTVAGFWSLLAGVASRAQAQALVNELNNPRRFARPLRVPTLSADETGYDPAGGYWRGAVWAPTTMMVIRGLERYGYEKEAREIATNNLEVMARVFGQTGTIWENYAPDLCRAGQPARSDFVGWSGLCPILYLLEYGVGLRPDAAKNELVWDLTFRGRQGCDRYRFNGHVVSLVAEPTAAGGKYAIKIKSDSPFTLKLRQGPRSGTVTVHTGEQAVEF